ncbi:MAG: 3-phosphoshikimate 1-carboxyvinyltransferase, partial [Myxococcota bacterium]
MSQPTAANQREIETRGPLAGRVTVPGSKSLTNRALLLAALADGKSQLVGGLESDDTVVMRTALAAVGIKVETSTEASGAEAWIVHGGGGQFVSPDPKRDLVLDCGNSGTTLRFLTAALSLSSGPIILDGNARMRERPIADLAAALRALGAELTIEGEQDCPPIRLQGGGLAGGSVLIDGSQSSQYVSAVAQIAPYAARDVEIDFKDGVIVSRPYIDLTLDVMRTFGADAEWREGDRLWIKAGQPYQARNYTIEPDASSAAYPFCAAAIAGGQVSVSG